MLKSFEIVSGKDDCRPLSDPISEDVHHRFRRGYRDLDFAHLNKFNNICKPLLINFNYHRKMQAKNSVDSQYYNLPFSFGENLELTDFTKMRDNGGGSWDSFIFIRYFHSLAYRWDLELSGPDILCFVFLKKIILTLFWCLRIKYVRWKREIESALFRKRTIC